MLYDPKWAPAETKPDLFSLEGFTAWLEKQPSAATYNFLDICGCAAHQYLVASGARDENGYMSKGGTLGSVFSSLDEYHFVAATRPWTFGAALERARASRSS